jgi:hypothetical protein
MMTKAMDMLFDPVKKISYRRLLAWSVGCGLVYAGRIGDDGRGVDVGYHRVHRG